MTTTNTRHILAASDGRQGNRLDLLEQELGASPDDKALLKEYARCCLSAGAIQKAIQGLHKLVKLTPEDLEGCLLLAKALRQMGWWEQAIAQLRQSLEHWPENELMNFELGSALIEAGKSREAIAYFERAIQLKPAFADAHQRLGRALRLEGQMGEAISALRRAVGIEPNNPQLLSDLADMLSQSGAADEAICIAKHAQRLDPKHVEPYHLLACLQIAANRFADATTTNESCLAIDFRSVKAHLLMAILDKRQGRLDAAIASYEQAIRIHQLRPTKWDPPFPREVAELAILAEERENKLYRPSSRLGSCLKNARNLLTVMIGCYGDFPQYSIRAMESVASGLELKSHCNWLIGLNECCPRTIERARYFADVGIADGIIESKRNLNKDPLLRLLLEMTCTPYILWIDDDTYFRDRNWPKVFAEMVQNDGPFDVAGQFATWGPRRDLDEQYMRFIRERPWWRGNEYHTGEFREWVPFVRGGLFIARTAFLRRQDFPDRQMIKAMDDVALGELVHQVGGCLVKLPQEALSVAHIGDGQRRGTDFDLPR